MKIKLLTSKIFRKKDLLWFSRISGDFNPIHIDEEYSRRIMKGSLVVPGMYLFLWSLNFFIKSVKSSISYTKINFHNTVNVNEKCYLYYHIIDDLHVLSLKSNNLTVATFTLKLSNNYIINKITNAYPPLSKIKRFKFKELKNLSGKLKTYLCNDKSKNFYYLKKYKFHSLISNFLAFSRLVGMTVPGLNSLFTGLELHISDIYNKKNIIWNVSRHTNIKSLIYINLKGNGVCGKIFVLYRPELVNQPHIKEIYKRFKLRKVKNNISLIIGGSRGLGEFTSKLLASNGSTVIISYLSGKKDALRVKNEIVNFGGKAYCVEIDIFNLYKSFNKLKKLKLNINQVYYFASPMIRDSRNKKIDQKLLREYDAIYVKPIKNLVKIMINYFSKNFSIFYPSSIYTVKIPFKLKEYAMSKIKAEKEIKILNKHYRKQYIYFSRLPVLLTDQNPSFSINENRKNIKFLVKEILKFSNKKVK